MERAFTINWIISAIVRGLKTFVQHVLIDKLFKVEFVELPQNARKYIETCKKRLTFSDKQSIIRT